MMEVLSGCWSGWMRTEPEHLQAITSLYDFKTNNHNDTEVPDLPITPFPTISDPLPRVSTIKFYQNHGVEINSVLWMTN